jgi:O-acetyl-ADP-ribose deacetylase (regulator of RNase III)
LASTYRVSLSLALQHSLRSIAFPAISTGAYGFPPRLAAPIAVDAVGDVVKKAPSAFSEVIFCCFSEESADLHRAALSAAAGNGL